MAIRPRVPDQPATVPITVKFSESEVAQIDAQRGPQSRSGWVRETIRGHLVQPHRHKRVKKGMIKTKTKYGCEITGCTWEVVE